MVLKLNYLKVYLPFRKLGVQLGFEYLKIDNASEGEFETSHKNE